MRSFFRAPLPAWPRGPPDPTLNRRNAPNQTGKPGYTFRNSTPRCLVSSRHNIVCGFNYRITHGILAGFVRLSRSRWSATIKHHAESLLESPQCSCARETASARCWCPVSLLCATCCAACDRTFRTNQAGLWESRASVDVSFAQGTRLHSPFVFARPPIMFCQFPATGRFPGRLPVPPGATEFPARSFPFLFCVPLPCQLCPTYCRPAPPSGTDGQSTWDST